MRNFALTVICLACLGAIGYFSYNLYWEDISTRFNWKWGKKEESKPAYEPPPLSAMEIHARHERQIQSLRSALVEELRNFQQTYDYRTTGWSGGTGRKNNAGFSEAYPEKAEWIGTTTNSKLRRARELYREIHAMIRIAEEGGRPPTADAGSPGAFFQESR
jgi:hypothetical protein